MTASGWPSTAAPEPATLLILYCLTGVFSNAIGYGIDQYVLRRNPVRRFSVLLALPPVSALIVGWVALDQQPSALDLIGMLAVIVGVALHRARRDHGAIGRARAELTLLPTVPGTFGAWHLVIRTTWRSRLMRRLLLSRRRVLRSRARPLPRRPGRRGSRLR